MLCPSGWHVPTDDEWTILITYLGGNGVAGGKLKETDTYHWFSPNTGATNETGFAALPGGFFGGEVFPSFGTYGYWWTSSVYNSSYGWSWCRDMASGGNFVGRTHETMQYGFSVRCMKD